LKSINRSKGALSENRQNSELALHMRMKKKVIASLLSGTRTKLGLLLLVGLLLFSVVARAQGGGTNIDKIIAKVDNYILLKSELEANYLQLMSSGQGNMTRCQVLESLMINKLLLAKAEIDSVVVSEKMVENQLDRRMAVMIGQFGGEEELLKAYGKTADQLKGELRKSMREQLIEQEMQKKITEGVKITPKEVNRFYSRIPKDSIPFLPTEVEVGQIVKIAEVSKEQKAAVKAKLGEIRQRIKNGEDFGELAKTFSEDFGSGKKGGNLGWAKRGAMVAAFEATAMKLKPGELSEVFESDYGYHILQLIEKRGSEYNSRHILLRPNYNEVDLTSVTHYLDSLRSRVINDSITFEKAAKEYSDDKPSAANGGLIAGPDGSTRITLDGTMDHSLYFVIDSMTVGTITKPIAYRTDDGKSAMRILYYKTKIPPHYASIKDDYQKIYNAALGQKKSSLLDTWFDKTKNEVYIDIDPEFRECNVLGTQ
jgi:peptidyl-prolyl cis-trans isomerase SurA